MQLKMNIGDIERCVILYIYRHVGIGRAEDYRSNELL
jgi:hypothetical protein